MNKQNNIVLLVVVAPGWKKTGGWSHGGVKENESFSVSRDSLTLALQYTSRLAPVSPVFKRL